MKRLIISALLILVLSVSLIPAVSRKVLAAPVYDVTSYGAYGGDTRDDTTAFQQALDAAAAAGGGTVRVPAGRYYIGSPSGMSQRAVWIYSNTTLEMDGAVLISNAANSYILQSWQCSNVTVKGGILDGNVSDTTIAQGLAGFGKMKNLTITGVTFRNFCATHAVVIDGVDTLKVSNCNFEGYKVFTGSASSYESQTQSTSFWSGEALHIDFLHNNSDGKFNVTNVEVWDCTFNRVLSGVGTHHVYDDLIADNIKIHDNTFLNCYYDCCNAAGFKNFQFYDNYAINTPILVNSMNIKGDIYGNYLDNRNLKPSASDIKKVYTFGSNYLELSDLSAIQLTNIHDGSASMDTNATAVNVYDNDIYVNAYALNSDGESKVCGIWATYDSKVNAYDNRIYNAPYRAIYINEGRATLSRNMIANSYEGIYLQSNNQTLIEGNTILNTTQRPVAVNESSNTTVKDNYINGASDETMGRGIVFQKTCTGRNIISGNTVMHTKARGILAYNPDTQISVIENNTVCFSDYTAILLYDGVQAGDISGNSFFKNNGNLDLSLSKGVTAGIYDYNTSDWAELTRGSYSVSGDSRMAFGNNNRYVTHNFVKSGESTESCEECPYTEYYSADTQTGYKELKAPTGHSWDGGTTVREATVDQAGLVRYTCTKNGRHTWERTVTYQSPEPKAVQPVSGFSDVQTGMVAAGAYKAIYWAVDNGIVKGYSDGTFRPEDICSREQFSIMLWRFAGEPSADTGAVNKFKDVSSFSNNTSKKAVSWALQQGIVAGFSDGSFKPKDDISRAQVAVMLWRFAGKPASGGSGGFSDIKSLSTNVQNAIIWAEKAGIAAGYNDGTFRPDGGCQRQHMAIFLNRYNSKVRAYKPE